MLYQSLFVIIQSTLILFYCNGYLDKSTGVVELFSKSISDSEQYFVLWESHINSLNIGDNDTIVFYDMLIKFAKNYNTRLHGIHLSAGKSHIDKCSKMAIGILLDSFERENNYLIERLEILRRIEESEKCVSMYEFRYIMNEGMILNNNRIKKIVEIEQYIKKSIGLKNCRIDIEI
jgi:hypothetical protein